MAIYRPAHSTIYVMDFMFHGKRFRESTLVRDYETAKKIHDERKQKLRNGIAQDRTNLIHGETTFVHHLRGLKSVKRISTGRGNERIHHVVSELNGRVGTSHLREIVEKWKSSGPRTDRLFSKYPDLFIEIQLAFKPSIEGIQSGCAGLTFSSGFGGEGDLGPVAESVLRTRAIRAFTELLFNPSWKRLRGPCPSCNRYFVSSDDQFRIAPSKCKQCKEK